MKKNKSIIIGLIFFIAGFGAASILPDTIEAAIAPASYDFSEVEVGGSQTTVVNITNLGDAPAEISGVVFARTNCSDFYVVSAPLNIPISPNETLGVEIGYAPSSVGTCTDTLRIYTGNPFPNNIAFSGTGVVPGAEEPGPVDVTGQLLAQIEEIKTFMEANLENGNLEAAGQKRESRSRLKALNNMLVITAHMIENGRFQAAQNKLREIYKKIDGKRRPQDFVKGQALDDLAARIEALIEILDSV